MKPFRFRLETLLRLREVDRDTRRIELAQALAEQQRLQSERRDVESRLAEQRTQDRRLRLSNTFSLELLRRSETLRQSLTAECTQISVEAAAAAVHVDVCQQQLAAAECDFQAVSKLREARQTEHQREIFRYEAKLADESAGHRCRHAS